MRWASLIPMLVLSDHAVACEAHLAPITPVEVSYNPFDARSSTATTLVAVRHADAPCAVIVRVGRIPQTEFSPIIGQPASPPVDIVIDTGGSARLELVWEAGFRGDAGLYHGTLPIELRQVAADGTAGPVIDLGRIAWRVSVAPAARVTLAGGGLTGRLDFGELATGARRTLMLHVEANATHTLTLIRRHGALHRTAGPGRIAYRTLIDGAEVERTTPSLLRVGNAAIHRFEIEIGEVEGAPAGDYRDVVTVTVAPRW